MGVHACFKGVFISFRRWVCNKHDDRTGELQPYLHFINKPDDKPSFYSRRWCISSTSDLAFCTENILHKIKQRNLKHCFPDINLTKAGTNNTPHELLPGIIYCILTSAYYRVDIPISSWMELTTWNAKHHKPCLTHYTFIATSQEVKIISSLCC